MWRSFYSTRLIFCEPTSGVETPLHKHGVKLHATLPNNFSYERAEYNWAGYLKVASRHSPHCSSVITRKHDARSPLITSNIKPISSNIPLNPNGTWLSHMFGNMQRAESPTAQSPGIYPWEKFGQLCRAESPLAKVIMGIRGRPFRPRETTERLPGAGSPRLCAVGLSARKPA